MAGSGVRNKNLRRKSIVYPMGNCGLFYSWLQKIKVDFEVNSGQSLNFKILIRHSAKNPYKIYTV